MIMMTEVFKKSTIMSGEREYSLREVLINPASIVVLREDEKMETDLKNGNLPEDLDGRQKFTKIHLSSLNNHSITVVGDIFSIHKKIGG